MIHVKKKFFLIPCNLYFTVLLFLFIALLWVLFCTNSKKIRDNIQHLIELWQIFNYGALGVEDL